ncbi:MAG: hypothetical protein O2956_13145, partial [Gemmatimonadetes bacterium]|nr:hypothetical protein [Gemmatimonadota bacterium]
MITSRILWTRASLCLVALGSAACQDVVESPIAPELSVVHGNPGQPDAFEVYSQNLYLGGDTGPLFSLDFTNIGAILAATNQFWSDVQASNIPERAAEIVDEIDERRPHVVSLQEAFRFVLLNGSFQPVGGLDLLAAVESEIANRGLPYEVAVSQEATSSTLPLAFSGGAPSLLLNFTDRVAILRRTDVNVLDMAQGQYAARFSLGPVTLIRAWARLTVDHLGTPHHFVATHLETQALAPVQAGQAYELENVVVAGLDGVTIIAGDLNSDAAAGAGSPSWTPTYDSFLAAGFTDVWATAPGPRHATGVTCCMADDLLGNATLDERIDFVLVRSSAISSDELQSNRGWFRAEVVGDEPNDRTPSGLWPSDHAGLAAL